MKLKTRVTKDFYKYFDEARGIAIQKRKVLKNKNSSCFTYTQIQLIVFIIMLFLGLFFMLLGKINYKGYIIGSVIFILSICYVVCSIASVIGYYKFRKNCVKKPLLIDENGVTDESFYDIKMIFSWKKILGIVITKNTVTFLTDTPIYFYLDKSSQNDIIELAERYNVQDKIIY